MFHQIAILFRRLVKKPSFSIPAILALALAIGANIMVFTIVNAVLIRALPYPDASRLIVISSVNQKTGKVSGASRLDMEAWREAHFITNLAGMYVVRYSAVARRDPVVVEAAVVNSSFFDLTGVKPILGRTFQREDEVRGSPAVALVSRSFWEQEMDGSPSAIGKSVSLDSKAYTVVGVVDSNAKFPLTIQKAEVWLPIVPLFEPRGVRGLTVIGRLKPGATLSQAQSELDAVAKRLSETVPADIGFGVSITMLQDRLVGRVRNALWFLQGAVLFLLLIASANVAHLALVATLGRSHEIGLHAALGAKRRQIVWQWACEGLVLGLCGAVLGAALAFVGVRIFLGAMPDSLPRLALVRADLGVLAFTVGVTLFAVFLFSIGPAAMIARSDPAELIRRGSRTVAGTAGRWLRSGLVIAEVALTLILLVGAGTLVRSLLDVTRMRWGFDPNGVLTMDVQLPFTIYGMGAKPAAFWEKMLDNVRNIHGVEGAGIAMTLPFSGDGLSTVAVPKNRPVPPPGQEQRTRYRPVSPGYFKAMSIPLLRGRDFVAGDRIGAPGVVILDETLANQLWPNQNPVGEHIDTRVRITGDDPREWEIVGVVGAVKDSPDEAGPPAHVYVPYSQQGWPLTSLAVKASGDPLSLAKDVRQAIRAVNPGQGVQEVNTMDGRISKSVALPRLYATLLSVFAGIGLVLSCIGSYGAIAYSVSQRTPELGVRMALGAEGRDLTRMIVGQGAVLIGAGLVLGAAGAFALKRTLTSISSDVHGINPVMFGSVMILVAITALAACYVPAKRASRLDPAIVLKYE